MRHTHFLMPLALVSAIAVQQAYAVMISLLEIFV